MSTHPAPAGPVRGFPAAPEARGGAGPRGGRGERALQRALLRPAHQGHEERSQETPRHVRRHHVGDGLAGYPPGS